MSDKTIVFDDERASSYERRFEKLAPVRDALHLFMRFIARDLPADARVLCVGAGTGAELLYLAATFPGWTFTLVDPAAPMLAVCEARAKKAGIWSRCEVHTGYLESLPACAPFHFATSILVSHFITDTDERRAFFRAIANRLAPSGLLVSADLAGDRAGPEFPHHLGLWRKMLEYTETPTEEIDKMLVGLDESVAVLPPSEVSAIIEAGGFEPPVPFFQLALIRAWWARKLEA